MSADELTGMPVLPEGYFWRVSHPADQWGFGYLDRSKLQVEIRVKRIRVRQERTGRFFRSWVTVQEKSSSVELVEECKGTAPVAVLNAARRAVKRFETLQAARALVGDYPPKSLAVAS